MHALRLSTAGAILVTVAAMAGSAIGCGPLPEIWSCNSPFNGKVDLDYYDTNHEVNGVPDPCHCYDPTGPLPTCPIVVDAGPDAP